MMLLVSHMHNIEVIFVYTITLGHTSRSGVYLPDKIEQKKPLIYGMPYRYSNVKFDGESIYMYINAKSLLIRVSFC